MKSILTLGLFFTRHLAGMVVASFLVFVAWTVTYLGLLIAAFVSGSGIGSPLAYPLWLLAFLGAGWLAALGIFGPACGFGLWICKRQRWRNLAAIPWVVLAAVLLAWMWRELAVVALGNPGDFVSLPMILAIIALPLVAYWWLIEGPGAVAQMALDWFRRRRA